MNFDSDTNKLVVLVVSGLAVLVAINMFQDKLGKQVSMGLCVLVILVCGYLSYTVLNPDEDNVVNVVNKVNNLSNEHFSNPNESYPPSYIENFENEADLVADAAAEAEAAAAEAEAAAAEAEAAAAEAEAAATEAVANNVSAEVNGNNSRNNGNSNSVNNKKNNGNSGNNLNSEQLLPFSNDTSYGAVVPNNAGAINTGSLLNAGHHIGINTSGCSMRNANRGLRSEPPNPQVQVSPWLQTTICPDLNRKPLDCNDWEK